MAAESKELIMTSAARPPFWAGPRTYGYEWVRLEDEKKRASWLDRREPPRGGESLARSFRAWLDAR